MALWGIDVAPKDVNIILPNFSDFGILIKSGIIFTKWR